MAISKADMADDRAYAIAGDRTTQKSEGAVAARPSPASPAQGTEAPLW